MKRKLFFGILFLFSSIWSQAQSIRKNYNEMTADERRAYKDAVASMKTTFQQLGCMHSYHFDRLHMDRFAHSTDYLMPWHRWFQYHVESLLKNAGTKDARNLTVPYWDWREEDSYATITWNNNDLLGSFDTPWNLGRTLTPTKSPFWSGAAANSIRDYFHDDLTGRKKFATFSDNLDRIHGSLHVWVGSALRASTSPYEPVFFFHHGFIDKLWQDWEDSRESRLIPRSVIEAVEAPHNAHEQICEKFGAGFSNSFRTPEFNPQNVVNSRNQDYGNGVIVESWYAYKKKLILDGLGEDFVTKGVRNYHYVAWDRSANKVRGKIYIGDLKRDSSNNIQIDNKGGFVIGNDSKVNISTAQSINFRPGFSTQNGAVLTAYISTDTWTNAQNTNNFRMAADLAPVENEEINTFTKQWSVYPNPVTDNTIQFGNTAATYELIDNVGNTIYKGVNSSKLVIDNLKGGLYFLKLENTTTKLMIQ